MCYGEQNTLRIEKKELHHFIFLRSYLSLMVDYVKSFGREQSRQHIQSQFYARSMYTVVFTSDWLEPYPWKLSLSLYLSGREELKRLKKLIVQIYNFDCVYN